MTHYSPKKFNIPTLQGISVKTTEEHIKLYEGYVKHTNLILEHIKELAKDSEKYAYELGELQRRFSFEFNGMKNHEYYFSSFEGGSTELTLKGPLHEKITEQWGSFDGWLNRFKAIAKTRGIGWAILYYDKDNNELVNAWVDEQHIGHLNSCQYIVGIDMWEHSFVMDYLPSGKGKYIDDYFANVNWNTVEKLFDAVNK